MASITWWAARAVVPDPSHHNGTETERSSFHSHLHGNGPSQFVQVQEVRPVERIVESLLYKYDNVGYRKK